MNGKRSKPGSEDAEDDKKRSSKKRSSDTPDTLLTNEALSSADLPIKSFSSSSFGTDNHKNGITDLPDALLKYRIGDYSTLKEQQKLRGVNRFFNQTIGEDRALNARIACYHVLTGQPEKLLKLLAKDPEIFFHTYPEISFKAAEQVYYNVSTVDLVYFLCDDDIWNKIKAFATNLPEDKRTPFFETWQKQQQAMGKGGADLLYVTSDKPPQYENCLETTEIFDVVLENKSLTRALLKNPDGIVCWKYRDNQVHLYYANPVTKVLEPIDVSKTLSETQQTAVDAFKSDMTKMRPNTVRRSSNAEHGLFKDIFSNRQTHQPIKLLRAGIHYKQDGIDTIDTHHDFNRLTNAYLKCIDLSQAAVAEQNPERNKALYTEADRVWRSELGRLQKEVIWVIQRFCEKKRPFCPLPNNFNASPFLRSFMIYNWRTDKQELLFDVKANEFLANFGVDSNSGFAIYKGEWEGWLGSILGRGSGASRGGVIDLIAKNRLSVDATNTVEIPIELPAPIAGLKLGR
ncbi:MAG: hypothetical protein A3E88_03450 [Legionellales bacterium RIFCSPHIGHO2_12_FULL_35_11]|nr:MAG: hypothetical protein A3E88_03450 [Legionellales bacterium RIFCSPHIGHO2_12_FULL_35_11]